MTLFGGRRSKLVIFVYCYCFVFAEYTGFDARSNSSIVDKASCVQIDVCESWCMRLTSSKYKVSKYKSTKFIRSERLLFARQARSLRATTVEFVQTQPPCHPLSAPLSQPRCGKQVPHCLAKGSSLCVVLLLPYRGQDVDENG